MPFNAFAVGSAGLTVAYIASRPARSAYLVVVLGVAIASWFGLTALLSPFLYADSANTSKVSVSNARAGAPMPLKYAAQIAAIPGVASLTYANYLPVICKAPTTVATLNGGGGPGVAEELAQYRVTDEESNAWQADLRGILVGATLARNCGWSKGSNVQPPDTNGRPVDLHVIGVFHSDEPYAEQIAIAHFDYLDRLADPSQRGQMLSASVRATDPADVASLAARIDAAFAHSDPPTHSTPNSATENSLARFGSVQDLIAWVIAAVFACAALVFVSVFAHAAAERRAALAVLSVIGFSRRFLFGLFVIESLVLTVAGALLGIAIGVSLVHLLAPSLSMVLGRFASPPWAWAVLPPLMLALLACSLIVPARVATRIRATDYQRA